MPDTSHQQRGFTLTELLITLTVAAIGLSIAVPSFQSTVNNNRRATAVNQLVSALHMARSEAVTRNMQVAMCPSANGQSCQGGGWQTGWIFFTDANQNRAVDAGDTILGNGPGPANLTISSTQFANFLVYRPSGRIMVNNPDQNTGQFTLCDSRGASFARVVIIDSSGQPSLSYHQMDGTAPVCP